MASLTPARRLGRADRRGLVGLALVLLVLAVALLGPLLAPSSSFAFVGRPFQPPGPGMALGTDVLGGTCCRACFRAG